MIRRQSAALILFVTVLQIIWPLNALTVYAQSTSTDPATTDPATTDPATTTSSDVQAVPNITADQLNSLGDATIVYNSQGASDQDIGVNPWIDSRPTAADYDRYDQTTASQFSGYLKNTGFYQVSGNTNVSYLVDDKAIYEGGGTENDTEYTYPTELSSTTEAATCSGDNPSILCSAFQKKISDLRTNLETTGAFERRLVVGSTTGQALLFGEQCDPTQEIKPADDVLVNGQCDRTPRVDARLILLLDYLLRSKKDGGAGREYLELASVARFNEEPRQEDTTYIDGTSGKCVVNVNAPATDVAGISTCIQIKAIDKVRVTTRIVKYGIFGTKTKYRYKSPIPIKVAWQSDEGQASTPLPALSTQELVGNYSVESLLEMLQQEDFLSDPDFNGRPLQSLGLSDIARFLGGRLLKQLLDGQNIANFNFGDTIQDFGMLALAGALNIDVNVLRNASSLEDIELAQGRSWVADQIGLDEPLTGANSAELFADVARQQIAKLLDIKPYVLDNYTSGEFMQRLGQGLIEMRLPVPEKSFTSNNVDEIKRAVSSGRFALVFPNPSSSDKEAQLAEIDERLGVAIGSTANFVRTGDAATYKQLAGQAVWDTYLGRYSDNVANGFVPEYARTYLERLTAGGSGAQIGDLTKLLNITDSNNQESQIAHPVGMTEADTAAVTTLTDRLNNLHGQIQSLYEKIQSVADSLTNCRSINYTNNSAVVSCVPISGYGTQQINLIEARQQALNALPKTDVEDEFDRLSRLADTMLAEASWNGEYVVLPSVGSQYYNSVTASLREISSYLKSSRDHIANYRNYGSNTDGSSQRVDQLMNLPAGTIFGLMSGGDTARSALTQAGIFTVANYLPTTNDQTRFKTLAASAANGTAGSMEVSDSQKKFLADVFLTSSPNSEFRRLGRRTLINNVTNSAQAQSLTQSQLWSDVSFYVDRFDVITNALNTVRTEANNLSELVTTLPAALQDQARTLQSSATTLFTLFNGLSSSDLTISGANGLVNDNRERIYGLEDTANSLLAGIQTGVNNVSGRLQTSVNNLTTAARAIEQAVMEVLEGRSVTVSGSTGGLTIPNINLSNFGQNSVASSNCTYNQSQISVLALLYGDLNSAFSGQATSAISADSLRQIFITLGSTQLANLLGMPMESFLYFSQVEDKSPDNFFISVGRGVLLSQRQNPNEKTDDELKTLGRDYVIAHAVTTLSSSLGVNLPDWFNENTIADMMTGRVDEVLLAVGSSQVENLLNLPSGTVTALVRPSGTTEAARQADRERTIINIVLAQLDVELDLPAGFTLTGDPTLSMGLARLEGVLGLDSGQLVTNTNGDVSTTGQSGDNAAWSIDHAITSIVNTASTARRSGRVPSTVYENDAEIAARAQLTASMGLSLPLGVQEKIEHLDALRKSLDQTAAGNGSIDTLLADISSQQDQILSELIRDNNALFTPVNDFAGSEFAADTTNDSEKLYRQDADSRQSAFTRRLAYLDSRLSVSAGSTAQWLYGQTTTDAFARQIGGGAAELLGANTFLAFLDRIGATGPWVDAIRNRTADPRTGVSNLELIKDVVLGQRSLDGDALAQLYTMMSQAMSFNLDEEAGFAPGTIAQVIATPGQAEEILFDQGVRIFARQVLHFNIDGANDGGTALQRLASAMLYGAFYNPTTKRFEGVSFESGITLNGAQAVAAGISEFTRIAQGWLNDIIPQAEWSYFQVPITMLFNGLTSDMTNLGQEAGFVQFARSQNELRTNLTNSHASAEEMGRVNELGYYNATLASVNNVDLPAGTDSGTGIFDIESLDQFFTQGRQNTPIDSNLTTDEQAIYNNQTYTTNYAGNAMTISYSAPSGQTRPDPSSTDVAAAQQQLQASGNRQTAVRNAQAYWQNTVQRVMKVAAYAAADYGLDKLLNLPDGVIKPGLAMTLFEGTTSQKVGAIVDIGINYLLNNVNIPPDLQFLLNYNNIREITAFFLNQDGRGNLLAQAFSPGGVFADLQTLVFPHGLFGEIQLPEGTFGAMVGFLVNGNVGDFNVNGVHITGLGNLFNGRWATEIGINYISKLIGVDSSVLTQTFQVSYNFYKAFEAWNTLSNMQLEEIANQISSVPGFNGDSIEAAKNKLAQAHDAMVTAAIALGVYVINMLVGKAINTFETALGLPPGTIMQGLSLALTAILVGTGPMFFVGLGIFVLTTLLGFGFVRTTIRATADGYYPMAGALGEETTAGQKGITYNQYPSSDVLDNDGNVITSQALGQFDPTKQADKKKGFMLAAQQKVKGVIMDSVNVVQLTKYLTSLGLINSSTSDADKEDMLKLMQPNQIFVTNTTTDNGKKLYVDDLDIIRLNRTYFNATNTDNNSGYCNKNHPAGICAGTVGQFVDRLEISY